jgi:branched-chain amino acid transport system permease protein
MLNFTIVSLIYVAFEVLLVLGLNVQYGFTGILNLSFIVPYAAGAYITGVISGPPPGPPGSGDYHIGGYNLPWYLGVLAGLAAAYLVAAIIGSFTLGRRLRGSFLTVGTLVIAVVLLQVVSQDQHLFNGQLGLLQVPSPISTNLSPNLGELLFLLIAAVLTIASFVLCEMLRRSPFGRMLRAIRDDDVAAQVFGYSVFWMKMKAFIFGGMLAALAGSLTIIYVGGFAPAGWSVYEIVFALTCLFVGGVGNNYGGLVGAGLVVLILVQASTLVPTLQSNPTLVTSIRSGLIGVMLILILRFRPQGIIPERTQQLEPEPHRGLLGIRAPQPRATSGISSSSSGVG